MGEGVEETETKKWDCGYRILPIETTKDQVVAEANAHIKEGHRALWGLLEVDGKDTYYFDCPGPPR